MIHNIYLWNDIKKTLNRNCSYSMLPGVSWATCIRFLPVECCPKSIKTTSNRIFFCALFFGASRMTSHRSFTCVIFSIQGVLRKHWTGLFLCNVDCNLLDNIAKGYNIAHLYYIVPKVLRQHSSGFFSCAMLSGDSWTLLHEDFTCSMLGHG